MNKIKEKALELIIEEAAKLFLENSISTVTMEDIAKASGIGAASLYRYFGTKQNIAVRVAVLLAQNVYNDYFICDRTQSGYEQLRSFYTSYLRVFNEKRNYFRFVREFDALFLADADDGKTDYESEIDLFFKSYMEAYNKGIEDKSINSVSDAETFYYTTTHSLLNLCKALTKEMRLVSQDAAIPSDAEIQTLIDIILYRIKK